MEFTASWAEADVSFPGYWAVYPYDEPSGGARFSVVKEGVQKVVFRSNDGSPLAGTVKVGFGDDNKPTVLEVSDALDSVVVHLVLIHPFNLVQSRAVPLLP